MTTTEDVARIAAGSDQEPVGPPIIGNPMSDRAVYLGDGVWWQLSERDRRRGIGHGLPERIRPWRAATGVPFLEADCSVEADPLRIVGKRRRVRNYLIERARS